MVEKKKVIAVDFDKPIHQYSKGWQDGTIYDPPIKGVKNALQSLITLGYQVEIFSRRCNEKKKCEAMVKWLDDNNVPYSSIYDPKDGKPHYDILVDDKALRFDHSWNLTLPVLLHYLNKP